MQAKQRRKKTKALLTKYQKRVLFIALPVFLGLSVSAAIALTVCGLGKLFPDEFLDNVLGPAFGIAVLALCLMLIAAVFILKLVQAADDAKIYDLAPYSAGEREEYSSRTDIVAYYKADLFDNDGELTLTGAKKFMAYLEERAPRFIGTENIPDEPYPEIFDQSNDFAPIAENLKIICSSRTENDVVKLTVCIECTISFEDDGLHAGESVIRYDDMHAVCRIVFSKCTKAVIVLFSGSPESDAQPIAMFRLDGRILGILRRHNIPVINNPLVLQAENNLKKTFIAQALKIRKN